VHKVGHRFERACEGAGVGALRWFPTFNADLQATSDSLDGLLDGRL
jgi:hypothetical protein